MTATDLSLTHVRFTVEDEGVAVALLDRSGEDLNTLNPEVASDLAAVVGEVERNPSIKALVIGSAKPDNFLAGADIRWLRAYDDPAAVVDTIGQGQRLFSRIERLHTVMGKPVVAAIHGACLGGGLELAMACAVRIASDDERRTQLGQPEVQIGLIPGAGGTQRLPRLVGIAAALDLMMTGRSVRSRTALKMALVDEICPEEVLLEVATTRARESIGRPAEPDPPSTFGRITGWLSPKHLQELALEDNPIGRRLLFSKAEERMLAETGGNYAAPQAIIRAVRAGVEQGPDAGFAAELAEFAALAVSPEAKALIGVFLDSQALKHDPGVDTAATPRRVDKVGVVGGGLMGGGIASVNTLSAGVRTRIKEVDAAAVGRGLAHVGKGVDDRVGRRRLLPREAAKLMQLVTGSVDWSGFGDADLVIEAVFEDLALKRSVLAEVEGATGEDTIFASNTSSIPITLIAAGAARPRNVIGMHYFSPVEKMPLLEVVVTAHTADEVTATCVAFGRRQGKTVIVVRDGTGFYTTRILGPYMNEVGHLLADGARVEDIDQAMVRWGFPVGPVTLSDEVGLDVGAKIGGIMQEAFGERMAAGDGLARLVADDRRGRKNGRGFYRYEDGERKGVDPSVYDVLGVTPGPSLGTERIQERLYLHLLNEAARCLEEGILRSSRDGDIGAVFGLGYPPFRGGPFATIDRIGAAEVVARLDALTETHGERYHPAQILRNSAASGTPLRG
ncbi:fatty acid oxidation complex subunit alpha FadJ [soil metagenome]